MFFAVLGDIHGDFNALARAMRRVEHVGFWLSVGDVASEDLRYPEPVAPLYWIKGNNEDFDFIASKRGGRNLHFLANATRTDIEGVTVGALGGTFAPTWYETPANALPVRGRDDKRRHLVREEVDACKRMSGVDVLLTHEAPRPFIVEAGGTAGAASRPRRLDAGKAVVNEVLAAMQPRLHFFGHHHRFSDSVRQGVRSIGLDLVSRSFVIVDAASCAVERVDMESS